MMNIAMATYNGEKYLREQLDLIFAQTVQVFEFIVCVGLQTYLLFLIYQVLGHIMLWEGMTNDQRTHFCRRFGKSHE